LNRSILSSSGTAESSTLVSFPHVLPTWKIILADLFDLLMYFWCTVSCEKDEVAIAIDPEADHGSNPNEVG
jgi:hypothetical protein